MPGFWTAGKGISQGGLETKAGDYLPRDLTRVVGSLGRRERVAWKAALMGMKRVMSGRDSMVLFRFLDWNALSNSVYPRVDSVADMLAGMVRTLSMMWTTPRAYLTSWFG